MPELMLSEVSICFEQKLSNRSPDRKSLTDRWSLQEVTLLAHPSRCTVVPPPLVMTIPATAEAEKQERLAQMEHHQHVSGICVLVSKCP